MATLSPPTSLAQLDLYRQTSSSPAPIGRNSVALRLYKVLGSTSDDDTSREALLTLSRPYSAPPSKIKDNTPSEDVVVNGADTGALVFLDGPPRARPRAKES